MSEKAEKLIRSRTLAGHRAVITATRHASGQRQAITVLAEYAMDLGAAVAKLIDIELRRCKSRKGR
jgi:hypothetical protein